jgi:hypothetical protein
VEGGLQERREAAGVLDLRFRVIQTIDSAVLNGTNLH